MTESEIAEASRILREGAAIIDGINILRSTEGATVTICSSNREGFGPDNELIEVCDDWTEWEDRRFKGHTLYECVTAALAAMPDRCKPDPVSTELAHAITNTIARGRTPEEVANFGKPRVEPTGTFIPLDGPLPDFIQGPPISRVCAPPVEAASLVPPGGNSRTITRGGEIEALTVLDSEGKFVRTITVATAKPAQIMEVYAHLKHEVEYAVAAFRRFGGIAAKAYAELGGDWGRDARALKRSLNDPRLPPPPCDHPHRIEQTRRGVIVTGSFYCPDCGLVFRDGPR